MYEDVQWGAGWRQETDPATPNFRSSGNPIQTSPKYGGEYASGTAEATGHSVLVSHPTDI